MMKMRIVRQLLFPLFVTALSLGGCATRETPDANAGSTSEGVTVTSQSLEMGGTPVHFLEAGPADGHAVVLLHGARFNAETWRELGTINQLAEAGYRVIAVDIPGFGQSPENSSLDSTTWLGELLDGLSLGRAVIVSPSMSGRVTFPLVMTMPDRVAGWVAVAPVGIVRNQDRLGSITCPVLAIWGENDRVVPVAQADILVAGVVEGRKIILPGARHPCYLDQPDTFHAEVLTFVEACF